MMLGCWILAGVMLQACHDDEGIDKPVPPRDLAALALAYDQPSLDFTAETAPRVVSGVLDMLDTTGVLCGWDQPSDLACMDGVDDANCSSCAGLDAMFDALLATASDDGTSGSALTRVDKQAFSIEGEGFLKVRRICDGLDQTPVPDLNNNGTIRLTAGFTERGLDPIVWGDFNTCRLQISGQAALIHGPVVVRLGGDSVPFSDLGNVDVLAELEAAPVQVDSMMPISQTLDLRYVQSKSRLEILIPVDDDHLIFFREPTRIGLRAANGDWTCDLGRAQCTNDVTGDVVPFSL